MKSKENSLFYIQMATDEPSSVAVSEIKY